jgi:hypothetical protein
VNLAIREQSIFFFGANWRNEAVTEESVSQRGKEGKKTRK